MSDTGGEEIRVQLARMEGKQDVANERLNNVQADVAGLRTRVHDLGNDVTKIQAERSVLLTDYRQTAAETNKRLVTVEKWQSDKDGERKGFIASGRAMVALISIASGGGIVALWEMLK